MADAGKEGTDVTNPLNLKVGDTVIRMLAGKIPMPLTVDKIENGIASCGDWDFDLASGVEIDEDLKWGPKYGITGSYLVKPN